MSEKLTVQEINELIDTNVTQHEKETDRKVLSDSIQYVTERMSLSKDICERVFGDKATVSDVYSMFNYISKEFNYRLSVGSIGKLLKGAPKGSGAPEDALSKLMKEMAGGQTGGPVGGGEGFN